jgi:hypothetical protein
MRKNLNNDQINRLWEHRLHVDNEFYSRLNFFLVFESVLMGVVGVLYSSPHPVMFVLRAISILGFCITLVWVYVQARHKYLLDTLNARCSEIIPEYRETIDYWKKTKWPFSTRWLLAYVIPVLVVAVWIVFIVLFFLQ